MFSQAAFNFPVVGLSTKHLAVSVFEWDVFILGEALIVKIHEVNSSPLNEDSWPLLV